MGGSFVGGAALGYADKHLLPASFTLPIVGRAGAIALAAFFLRNMFGSGLGGIARDVALAGSAVAGYEMGSTGTIAGDVPSQVRGIASQV